MSATNHTVTVELSQYISTDKPTYLTDYNGDMLKIDDAIAADRDSISGVSTVASRADGKADTNKTNIDALNVQLNGDPEDPTDVGIAGDLNAVEGTVNTVTSLIGSGSPTTSDQTIIGAINGLEGSVAPREDAANFANSYAIGAKFARGGTVYEALASITAGTAFASLVLNTDYKVADTLVKQIEDAASGSGVIGAIVNSVEESIAPREDGTTLGASYSIGDQFIRAGVLYEALASLTAGDTFASLVLNTDYKVAKTIVEQIADIPEPTPPTVLPDGYYLKTYNSYIEYESDGTKTKAEVLGILAQNLITLAHGLTTKQVIRLKYLNEARLNRPSMEYLDRTINPYSSPVTVNFVSESVAQNRVTRETYTISSVAGASSYAEGVTTTSASYTYTDHSSETLTSGYNWKIYYDLLEKF